MNQEKIGKLIAKLRKDKGLTQQQLGDMVNVGHRAVSKWERGINLPDSSLYKPLCDIFDITIDELLNCELKDLEVKHNKERFNYKLLFLIIPVLMIICAVFLLLNNNDSDRVYFLQSIDDDYYVDGKIVMTKNDSKILIDRVVLEDYDFNNTLIKNYEYYILSGDEIIYGFGNSQSASFLDSSILVKEFLETFKINYKIKEEITVNNFINNKLTLRFIFINENNSNIIKDIPIDIIK